MQISLNAKGGFRVISAKFFEPVVYKFMFSCKGDVFIDIGANVGVYSLLNYRRFNKIISVEPGRIGRILLNKNIELNHRST